MHAQNDPCHLDPVGECQFVICPGISPKSLAIFLTDTFNIRSNYTNAIVVFDGYAAVPSTTDMAHVKRCGATHTPAVLLTD